MTETAPGSRRCEYRRDFHPIMTQNDAFTGIWRDPILSTSTSPLVSCILSLYPTSLSSESAAESVFFIRKFIID